MVESRQGKEFIARPEKKHGKVVRVNEVEFVREMTTTMAVLHRGADEERIPYTRQGKSNRSGLLNTIRSIRRIG